jgi:hypothetical protein
LDLIHRPEVRFNKTLNEAEKRYTEPFLTPTELEKWYRDQYREIKN